MCALELKHTQVWDEREWFSSNTLEYLRSIRGHISLQSDFVDGREEKITKLDLSNVRLVDPFEMTENPRTPIRSFIWEVQETWPEAVRLGFTFARAFKQLSRWPYQVSGRGGIQSIACIGAVVKFCPGNLYYLRLGFEWENLAGLRVPGPIRYIWKQTSIKSLNTRERVALYIP